MTANLEEKLQEATEKFFV